MPNAQTTTLKSISRGLTVREVISAIRSCSACDVDEISLDGSTLHPDDDFDDFYESRNQIFVFSKVTQPSTQLSLPQPLVFQYLRDFSKVRQLRILGSGGHGSVTLVEDTSTGEKIVLKSFGRGRTGEQDITETFFREIETLILLTHPCVVRIIGYSLMTETSLAQIGTEFVSGGSLREAFGRLDDTGKAIVICGIVMGMRFIHGRCVVHRDLKPENIMLDERGFVKINDLGNIRFCNLDFTMTQSIGTPLYMAPEMFDRGDYTSAVDVYSFAMIVYELLIGSPAFPPTTPLPILVEKASGCERPDLPSWMNVTIRGIIKRCWSSDADVRDSFDDIFDRLHRISFKVTPVVDSSRVAEFITIVEGGLVPIALRPECESASPAQMDALERQSADLRRELGLEQRENGNLRDQLEQHQRENVNVRSQLEQQLRQNEDLRKQVGRERRHNHDLEDQLGERERENNVLRSEIEQQERQNAALRNELHEETERWRREVSVHWEGCEGLQRDVTALNDLLNQSGVKRFPRLMKKGRGTTPAGKEVDIDVPDGIIAHLTMVCGGNVHDHGIVDVTSSKAKTRFAAESVVDLDAISIFWSGQGNKRDDIPHSRNNWICYDFKDRSIVPTHYAIRSCRDGRGGTHMKS
jgi:serine/threonine protein kinase